MYNSGPALYPGFEFGLFVFLSLVASCTALRLPQLVHLGDSLLELDVLALLVAVSLILVNPPMCKHVVFSIDISAMIGI
jgi:hypothetical protein